MTEGIRDSIVEKILGVRMVALHESLHIVLATGLALPVRSLRVDPDGLSGECAIDHKSEPGSLFSASVVLCAPAVFFINAKMPTIGCEGDMTQLADLRKRYRDATGRPMEGELELARTLIYSLWPDILSLAERISAAAAAKGLSWDEADLDAALNGRDHPSTEAKEDDAMNAA